MKKSKLYGSRLIEDNKLTITPELVTLESTDDVTNLTFDRGNILDAASIKLYLAATSDDLTTKYNTLNENVTTNSNDIITINTLLTTTAESINSINANITTINNSLVDYGIALEYVDNKLILKNKNSDTLSSIDLSTMTEDTYLDTVTFSNNKLIFTWNEGSSKKPITIDLSRLKDKDGNELSVGNILAKSKLLFLSKNDSDTAKGLITFMKGVRIGNYTSESGGVIDVDLITGLTYLEVDKLKVRMKAYFETLSIVNELSIAGKWTISPGGSILCTRVNITPELNYKCYFTNTLDNVQIENKFAVNDLAISKDFNIKTVEYQSATNHYYWRKVLEVGEDYIVLSKTDCDTGSDAPNVGDVICLLGNTTDVDRQNALVFSSVDDLSPCVNLYSGINSYSLANKEYVSYGVDKTTNKAFMNVYGDMYFGDRPTADNNYTGVSFIKYDSTNKKVTIKGELDVLSTVGGTNINLYIKNNSLSDTDVNSLIANSTVVADLLSLIDGSIETFFYSGVPTLSNLPASSWVLVATETNKETYSNHIGDLYYDKDTGKAYRFMLDGNTLVYSWVLITDTDITKALSDSADALSTANVKKRIFYGTPIVPYDLGDLWVNATYPVGTTKTDVVNNLYYKEILYCTTAKALGSSFSITDWNLSNNYTNMSNSIITDLNGYAYIKAALANDTLTSGGLILSSLIALRDADNNILSGINGILNETSLGKGIATWWGGKMIDGLFTPDITTTTVQDYATSLIRFNGSGYLANGAISWDTNGKIHADPTSFFVGPTSIGIIASLFSTIPVDATSYSLVTKIHPTKPFDTLSADTITATTFIGELQGNAATATKLKTARTIWGQSFDGTGNITGGLTFSSDNYFKPNDESHLSYGVYYDPYPNNAVALKISGGLAVGPLLYVNGTFHASGAATLDSGLTVTGNILATGNVGIGTTTPQYKLDVNGNARIASDLYVDSTVGTRNFASRTTGWNVNAQGAADFRNIYADELRVQAFTADISQALAGSDYLTKSVSKLSANFVVPSANSTVRIIVDDIEGMPATRCFANGDYIRFRAFNRTSGLTIANVWGTVVLDTTYGTNGFSNGTQAYTFTCKATSGAGLTVFKGSEVLDYGTSGSGMIARTTLDAQGSPYEQIATWINDPSVSTNYTVHARLGNLNGIANCNGYGLYSNKAFLTDSVTVGDLTKTNHYLDFSNGKLTVQGDIRLSSGDSAVSTLDMSHGISLAVDNIQIGGRNLFGYNKGITGFYASFTEDRANNGFWFDASTEGIRLRLMNLGFNGIGGTFTVSGYIKASTSTTDCNLNLCDYEPIDSVNVPITTSYTYFTRTYENVQQYISVGDYNGFLDFENLTVGVRIYLKDFKIERGNKATTYTPAPEDVDASISLKVSKDGVIGAINLTSEAATIQASKINLIGAVTIGALDSSVTAAALGGATPSDVSTAVNNIQIGSRNFYLRNTNWSYYGGWAYHGITTDADGYIHIHVSDGWALYSVLSRITSSQVTVSYDIKASNATGQITYLFFKLQNTPAWSGGDKTALTTEWTHKSFTTSVDKYLSINAGVSPEGKGYSADITIRNLMVEEGNKETSWTPAPEDVAQDVTNKVNELSAAHGGFTFLDSKSIYTGTLTAEQVNAVAINANSITTGTLAANIIAANSITGDKIVGNSITGDKLVMNTITALGNVTAGSFNIGSGKFVVDANGNTTTVNMTAVNATISGTLNGVSGTFNYLQGIGSNGKFWFNNKYDSMAIEYEDFSHIGTKHGRQLRFSAANIRCRGSFGASRLNMARVHDTYIDYYVNGDTDSYVRFNLLSNGVGGYYIRLYPTLDTGYSLSFGDASLEDVYGFPVDLLIFDNSAIYHYEMLPGACGKKVTVINAHDGDITVYLAKNGNLEWSLFGGAVQEYVNIIGLMNPTVSSSVHGSGWFMISDYDNNWA